jgi:hypothetical protein
MQLGCSALLLRVPPKQKQALTQSEQDGLLGSLFNAEQIALVDT